jgi:ribosome-associated translation inhibitor RaiA
MKDRGVTKKFANEDGMIAKLSEHSKKSYKAIDDVMDDMTKRGSKIKTDQNIIG